MRFRHKRFIICIGRSPLSKFYLNGRKYKPILVDISNGVLYGDAFSVLGIAIWFLRVTHTKKIE